MKTKTFLLSLFFSLFLAINIVHSEQSGNTETNIDKSDIKTDHLVHTKILYDEIYDIDISEGHYRASVEVLLAWEDKMKLFMVSNLMSIFMKFGILNILFLMLKRLEPPIIKP